MPFRKKMRKENRFLMLFQTCTKLTFGLSDVFVVTVIVRNRINGVGWLFTATTNTLVYSFSFEINILTRPWLQTICE